MAEVELGQLAAGKATNEKVKDFGKMMITDHSKANDELKTLAQKLKITLPTAISSDEQKAKDDWQKNQVPSLTRLTFKVW